MRKSTKQVVFGVGGFWLVFSGAALIADGVPSNDRDSHADRACLAFHKLAVDYSAGHLTLAELRDGVKATEAEADRSDDVVLKNATGAMLAGITAGDQIAFFEAAAEVSERCDKYRDG